MDHPCKRNRDLFITLPSSNDWCDNIIYRIHFVCMNYGWVPMNSTCCHETYRLFEKLLDKIFHLFVLHDVFISGIHFIQSLVFNNWVRLKKTIFLYHSFLSKARTFFFCRLAWYFLVKQIDFFSVFFYKKYSVFSIFVTGLCFC